MCGIAGFLGPWPEQLIEAMVASLRHRGPDGNGHIVDAEACVALGHARLSIIDLTNAAAQPMASSDGRYTLTFNGEIYNYRVLRQSLESSGVAFKTSSDTEVLLHLYMREGPDCLKRLNGIFAFAIWDRDERRLFIARDHLGVKPLYYAELTNGFLFASELKSLVLCPDLPREIDPVAVADHLGFLWTAGEATMLRQVRKLRPGCTLTVDVSGVRVDQYYRTPVADSSNAATAGELQALIDDIVTEQMVADVEVGALLSGGVDSSAIVASMCRVTEPSNITTFCATVEAPDTGTDNFGDDESFAASVAESFGVKLIKVPTDADLIDSLQDMVWSLDEPTADFSALQTLFLARAARENGIKVLMSGVGGDDLFTGYGRHTAALAYAALNKVPGLRQVVGAFAGVFPSGSIIGRRIKRTGDLLRLDEESMLTDAMSFSAVGADRRLSLMTHNLRSEVPVDGIPAAFRKSFDATQGLNPVERLLDLELNGFMPDHNLNYTDKMAMQAGVEVRVPLCDPRLIAFARGLPLNQLIDSRQTKKILRASQQGRVSDGVLVRSKQGFGVPVRSWLKGPARPLMEELTAESAIDDRGLFDADSVTALREDFLAGRIDAAMTLFPLMAIEAWCRALDDAPIADLSGLTVTA
jgi:asparagine synthase (glutamine-hydrolysing)